MQRIGAEGTDDPPGVRPSRHRRESRLGDIAHGGIGQPVVLAGIHGPHDQTLRPANASPRRLVGPGTISKGPGRERELPCPVPLPSFASQPAHTAACVAPVNHSRACVDPLTLSGRSRRFPTPAGVVARRTSPRYGERAVVTVTSVRVDQDQDTRDEGFTEASAGSGPPEALSALLVVEAVPGAQDSDGGLHFACRLQLLGRLGSANAGREREVGVRDCSRRGGAEGIAELLVVTGERVRGRGVHVDASDHMLILHERHRQGTGHSGRCAGLGEEPPSAFIEQVANRGRQRLCGFGSSDTRTVIQVLRGVQTGQRAVGGNQGEGGAPPEPVRG